MKRSILKVSKSDDKQEVVREAIVRKAAALFEQRGFRATSVQDIADGVGISKPTFYTYLDSKNDILSYIFDTIGSEALESARSIFNLDLTAAEKLRELMRSHLRALVAKRDFYAVYFQEKAELPRKLRLRLKAGERDYQKVVEEVFRQGAADGTLPRLDARFAALGVIGMCNWTYRWYRPSGPLTPADIADRLFEVAVGGQIPVSAPFAGASSTTTDP